MPAYRILIGVSPHERWERDAKLIAGEVVEGVTRPPIFEADNFAEAVKVANGLSLKEGERIRGIERVDLRILRYQVKVWDSKTGSLRTFSVMAQTIEQALNLAIPKLGKHEVLKKLWLLS